MNRAIVSSWFVVVAVFAVFICPPVLGATVVKTLQQGRDGYTGAGDAWLDESDDDENNGGLDYFHIRAHRHSDPNDTAVIRFDLSPIPSDQRILMAKLELWYKDDVGMVTDNAITIKPYRINRYKDWYENDGIGRDDAGVNWGFRDQQGYINAWTSPGGALADNTDDGCSSVAIKDTGGSVPGALEPQDWAVFTVTSSVDKWYRETEQNNGFVMVGSNFVGSGDNIAGGEFSSKEWADTDERPKLVITYEGALLPVADANGPYEVGPGQHVQLDASGSYDPDGGDIAQWLWDIDMDGEYDDQNGETVDLTFGYLHDMLGIGDHTIGLKVFDDEGDWGITTAPLKVVPEPASLCLTAIGGLICGLGLFFFRRF